MNHQKLYATISPESLENYAESAGLGGDFPLDLDNFLEILGYNIIGLKILEIGSGTGRLGIHLLDKCHYTGIETSHEYIKFFKARAQLLGKPYPNIYNESFEAFSVGEKFDIILFPWTVIGDFSDQIKIFEKVKILLNNNGKVLLDNPAKGTPYNVKTGYKPIPFYYDDWKDILRRMGFKTSLRIYKTSNERVREIVILEL